MNEYLCRNFVAQEIITEMSLDKISKRIGTHINDVKSSKRTTDINKNNLVDDEGSTNYKDWLSK